MKKIVRKKDFEFSININSEEFLNPPLNSQRNIILNDLTKEIAFDLEAMNEYTSRFVRGKPMSALDDRSHIGLTDEEIMEDWQIPIMTRMASIVGEHQGKILEIGFGRGIASSLIQQYDIGSHTIIECNEDVIRRFHEWKKLSPEREILLVEGLWQDTLGELEEFDGIFFHTYPLNEDEYVNYVHSDITFAGHFFPHASKHLCPGGVFTYMTNEVDSLSREHQRLLLRHFSSFSVELVALKIPEDVVDSWWADSMVIVKAVK